MDANIREMLQSLLYVVVVIILPIVTKYGVAYLTTQTESMSKQIKDAQTAKLVQRATEIVQRCVVATAQTYSDKCKELSKDNKLTEEQMKEAYQRTYNATMVLVTDEMRQAIAETYDSVNRWINTQIESTVAQRNEGELKLS